MKNNKILKFIYKSLVVFILILLTINFTISMGKDAIVSILNSEKFINYSKIILNKFLTKVADSELSEEEELFYKEKIIKIKKKLKKIDVIKN